MQHNVSYSEIVKTDKICPLVYGGISSSYPISVYTKIHAYSSFLSQSCGIQIFKKWKN